MTANEKLRSATVSSLDNALDELVLAAEGDGLSAEILDTVVARHPTHAAELTDFAVEWHVQAATEESAGVENDDEVEAAARVARAAQRFRDRLDAEAFDPFAGRAAAELKQLGADLGLDASLVVKLRDRRIEAATVPESLRRDLASSLDVAPAVLAAHLEAPPVIHPGVSFKASAKPSAEARETFAQAVISAVDAGANLANANIANADLAGADLTGARFQRVTTWLSNGSVDIHVGQAGND